MRHRPLLAPIVVGALGCALLATQAATGAESAPPVELTAPGGVLEPLGPTGLSPTQQAQRTRARRAAGFGEPDPARARRHLGLARRASGRAERAASRAERLRTRATELEPAESTRLLGLARTQEAISDRQSSVEAYHLSGLRTAMATPTAATCAAPPKPSQHSIFTLPAWSDLGGWSAESQYGTIQLADVDGDGGDEVLGRDATGIQYAALTETTGVFGPLAGGPALDDAAGWDQPQFALTIRSGDIDGDGRAEIIALNGAAEIVTFDQDPASGDWIQLPAASTPGWDDEGTDWAAPEFYSTVQLVDLDGDGGPVEIVARTAKGLVAARFGAGPSPGTGAWSALPAGPALGPGVQSASIRFGELDGQPGAELVALNGAPAFEAFSFDPASGTWSPLGASMPDWPAGPTDWPQPGYSSTVRLANLDGDPAGLDELVVRSADGLVVASWDAGSSAWVSMPTSPVLSDEPGGWNAPAYYESLRVGDFDGDGADELFIRAYATLQVLDYDPGATAASPRSAPAAAPWVVRTSAPLVPSAWNDPQDYRSFRVGDVNGDGAEEIVGRDAYGIRTFELESGDLVPIVAPFPAYSGADCSAYQAIQAANSGVLEGARLTDLRAAYGDAGVNLGLLTVPSTRPSGVSATAWNTVAPQIRRELTAAKASRDWHGANGMGEVITNGYSAQPGSVTQIGDYFVVPPKSSIAGDIIPWLEGIVTAVGLLAEPEGQVISEVAAAGLNSILEFTQDEVDGTSNRNFELSQTEAELMVQIGVYRQQAINANTQNAALIPREYGLMMSLQDEELPTAGAPWQTMWRQSDIFFWQTFGAAFWNVSSCRGTVREGLTPFQCVNWVRDKNAVDPQIDVGANEAFWIGSGSDSIRQPDSFLQPPPDGSTSKAASEVLFGTPLAKCTPPLSATSDYTNDCLLGIDEEEVYRGRGGWDLPRNFVSECLFSCGIGPSPSGSGSTASRAARRG